MRISPIVPLVVLSMFALGCRQDVKSAVGIGITSDAASSARLLVERSTVEPGTTVGIGIMIRLAEGWHTYADPPGDSGMAPILHVDLPEGIKAGPLRYPRHKAFRDDAGTTFGFEDSVLLRIPVTVDTGVASSQDVPFRATLDYLICKEACLPQRAELTGTLRIGRPQSAPTPEWRGALSEGGWMSEGEETQEEG